MSAAEAREAGTGACPLTGRALNQSCPDPTDPPDLPVRTSRHISPRKHHVPVSKSCRPPEPNALTLAHEEEALIRRVAFPDLSSRSVQQIYPADLSSVMKICRPGMEDPSLLIISCCLASARPLLRSSGTLSEASMTQLPAAVRTAAAAQTHRPCRWEATERGRMAVTGATEPTGRKCPFLLTPGGSETAVPAIRPASRTPRSPDVSTAKRLRPRAEGVRAVAAPERDTEA